jgi:3-deoxy-manno-octulosonate cytidylyltransferase (CMP-KDO synthetase)
MIQHVVERARQARRLDLVLVATDDDRVRAAVEAFGCRAVMTSAEHPSGTDRVAEVARGMAWEVVVNIQGDEPTLDPASIDQVVTPLLEDPTVPMATLCTPIWDEAEARDPNNVKVVRDRRGFALYFSRAPIPHYRDARAASAAGHESRVAGDPEPGTRDPGHRGASAAPRWWKHVGLYAYRRDVLLRLAALPPVPLERAEQLEQLRALAHDIRIQVVETDRDAIGVDVPEDLGRVAALLAGPGSRVASPGS